MTGRDGKVISFRPAVAADLPWIQACVEAAYALYVERIGRRPAPMDDDYPALVADGAVTILEDDGARAGFIVWHVAHDPHPDHLFVDTISVDPARQGRGLGRALMMHAESEATRRGLLAIRLYTNEKMTENLVFYPRLGYRQTGRVVEKGFSRVYLEKALV